MIATGFPRNAAFVAATQNRCNAQMSVDSRDLSRRRSRVRVPSLPFEKYPQTRVSPPIISPCQATNGAVETVLETSATAEELTTCRGPPRCGAFAREVPDDGEHAPVVVRTGEEAELVVDVRDVLDDGFLGKEELLRDRLVRAALGHQGEHLALAGREPLDGIVAANARDHRRDNLRIEHHTAATDPPDI